MMRAHRRWFGFAALLLVAAVAAIAMRREPFDPEAWERGGGRERNGMLDDLRRSHELVGRTRDEVFGLLGEPDLGSLYLTDDPFDGYDILRVRFDARGICCEAAFPDTRPWPVEFVEHVVRLLLR